MSKTPNIDLDYNMPSSTKHGDYVDAMDSNMQKIDTAVGSKAETTTYSATIGTTWTGVDAPYTQTILVEGILATDNPLVDVVLSDTYATAVSQQEDFAKIFRITTAAGSITVYATEQTTVALTIQLKVVR